MNLCYIANYTNRQSMFKMCAESLLFWRVSPFRRSDSAVTEWGGGAIGGGGAGAAGSHILLYNKLQYNSPVDYLNCKW